jgi:hypothetical protein
MANPSLTDINNYFATRKNQFDQNIYAMFFRTNPFASLFPRSEFNLEGGRIPEVITNTFELPTAYPFGLPNLALNTNTADGVDSTDVAPTIIKSGYKSRTYQLEVAAYQTEVLNLTDLQFQYQLAQQVANKEAGLAEFANVWQSDWYRVHNIGMLNCKVSTNVSATAFSQKSDALYDFTAIANGAPTFDLSWSHLHTLYDMMVRKGAGKYAIGTASSGGPVFSLTTGPGYKRALFQNFQLVRDTVNWSPDSLQNFAPRGINTAIDGLLPNVDEFPMRFKNTGTQPAPVWVPIYPTINQATGVSGSENVPNPDYMTVANGGLATHEVATILCNNIYEVNSRPVGPLGAGKAKFDATTYGGEVQWINNKDMVNNVLGNKGFYRLDIQQAAKAKYPQLGFSILTQAKD